MARQMTEEEIYEAAKKRVEAKQAFRTHVTVYICVNIFLILIWAFASGGGYPWFLFPLGGWGIGLFFHYREAFGSVGKTGKAAIEKEAYVN